MSKPEVLAARKFLSAFLIAIERERTDLWVDMDDSDAVASPRLEIRARNSRCTVVTQVNGSLVVEQNSKWVPSELNRRRSSVDDHYHADLKKWLPEALFDAHCCLSTWESVIKTRTDIWVKMDSGANGSAWLEIRPRCSPCIVVKLVNGLLVVEADARPLPPDRDSTRREPPGQTIANRKQWLMDILETTIWTEFDCPILWPLV